MSPERLDAPDALAALLAYIAGVRDKAIAEIDARAAAECRELVVAARHKARERVASAVAEERRDADAQVRLALTASQGRVRRARQALVAGALAEVWGRIERALGERWREGVARRHWLAMALAEAVAHLPDGSWRIAGPAQWDVSEAREEFARVAADRNGVKVEFEARAEIDAGVRIACGPAMLDATAAGLLAARGEVAAAWLGALSAAQAAAPAVRTGT